MLPRIKPLKSALSRGSSARHDKFIERHAALQTKIEIVSLFFTVVTTVFIVSITFLQYRANDRQVSLEYAKVAPRFNISISTFPSRTTASVDRAFPRSISVSVSNGNNRISELETYQDFRISVVYNANLRKKKIYTCIVRTKSYFKNNSNKTGAIADDRFSRIAAGPVFGYPDIKTFFAIAPMTTWVKITYVDVFGDKKSALYANRGNTLNQIPGTEPALDQTYQTLEADLSYDKSSFPDVWSSLQSGSGDCKMVSDSALFNH